MAYDLLIIDPQNDFLDIPGAALPVTGANADMDRLAQWLGQHLDEVASITVTLDSHASVGIERTSFWQHDDGKPVAAFTVITAADMQAGKYKPRHAGREADVLAYLQALETSAKRQLVVWPVHCVVGTWGHNIHSALSGVLAQWEAQTGKICDKVLKGLNPMTEQYSAFKAEVPIEGDPRTALRRDLLERLGQGSNTLLVAGEASSHCVAASVEDMLAHLAPQRVGQMVLLTDCMSPVGGFEESTDAMLERARRHGVGALAVGELIG